MPSLHPIFHSRASVQPHHDVESIPINAGVVEVGRPDVGEMAFLTLRRISEIEVEMT